jgi:nucleoid-associated protein YgaU
MILRPIITLLMFCCLTAHAVNKNIELQKNHPDHYVFVIGDTLWGISEKFLKDH